MMEISESGSGLDKHCREQLSGREYAKLLSDIEKFCKDHTIAVRQEFSELDGDTTLWFYSHDQRLGAYITGYLMALGFNENGERDCIV